MIVMGKRILSVIILLIMISAYAIPVYADNNIWDGFPETEIPEPIGTTSIEEAKAMYPSGYHTFYIVNDIKYATPDGQIFDDAFDYIYYMRNNYSEYADAKTSYELTLLGSDYTWNLTHGIEVQDFQTFNANRIASWNMTRQLINDGRIETISAIYVDLTYEEKTKLGFIISGKEKYANNPELRSR